jgi:hypothetical protein
MKPMHIYDELFRKNFYISYGVPAADLQKAVKTYIGNEWEADIKINEQSKCMLFDLNKTKGAEVIWLWTKERKPWILCHEIIHACFYCFGEDRVRLDENSQELYAYYAEMLMRKILKKGGDQK